MARRAYEQTARAEAADETRARVLDALHDRLREAPSRPVSVDEVARRAKVARSTIYLAFGSRTGMFDALTDRLLEGEGYERILTAVRDPDPRVSLRDAVRGGVVQYGAHHAVFRVLVAMGKLDPDGVGLSIARAEARRRAGVERLAGRLHDAGLLRPGMTAAQAADRIWPVAGFDIFDSLVTDRGLDHDAAADTLADMAARAVLADPASSDHPGRTGWTSRSRGPR